MSHPPAAPPRVLLAVTVYGGRSTVPPCLRSVARLVGERGGASVDAVVLDDASPEPGWSDEVRDLCLSLGIEYHRSPRNLGIPRNVNLGMRTAVERGYDHVVVCNSDIIVPLDLVERLLAVAGTDPGIGSVTAFSNNVSAYSMPCDDAERYLSAQEVVDWLSVVLAGRFGNAAVDVPAGISFCMLVPAAVVRRVGLMDPVFGRGYCEETDWTLRSKAAGYRITLAPGTFVHHQGQGSTSDAGIVSAGQTTVPANERIIDHRWPLFRSQVAAFLGSSILPTLRRDAAEQIVRDGARAFGWTLHVGWLGTIPADSEIPRAVVRADGSAGPVELAFRGCRYQLDLAGRPVAAALTEELGGPPANIDVFGRGPLAEELASAFPDLVTDRFSYPEPV